MSAEDRLSVVMWWYHTVGSKVLPISDSATYLATLEQKFCCVTRRTESSLQEVMRGLVREYYLRYLRDSLHIVVSKHHL